MLVKKYRKTARRAVRYATGQTHYYSPRIPLPKASPLGYPIYGFQP